MELIDVEDEEVAPVDLHVFCLAKIMGFCLCGKGMMGAIRESRLWS